MSERIFAEQAQKNKVLEYSYQDLFVKVPETQQDVVNEATAQHNCLRSYIEKIGEGRTRVAFIRKKDEPDKSYITVEVDMDNRIIQVKGPYNRNPRNKTVNEFISKWCNACGLKSA